MIIVFILAFSIGTFCLCFNLGRIYEINCLTRQLDDDISEIDEEIEAEYEKIIKRLAEEEGVTDAR